MGKTIRQWLRKTYDCHAPPHSALTNASCARRNDDLVRIPARFPGAAADHLPDEMAVGIRRERRPVALEAGMIKKLARAANHDKTTKGILRRGIILNRRHVT